MSGHEEYPGSDPYRQDEFLSGEAKTKTRPGQSPFDTGMGPMTGTCEDSTNRAIGTLIGYIIFWLLGSVVNLVYLNQARNYQKQGHK